MFSCVRVCEGVPGELLVVMVVVCWWPFVLSSVVRVSLRVGDGRVPHPSNDVAVQVVKIDIRSKGE